MEQRGPCIAGYQLPADGEPEDCCCSPVEVRAICERAEPFYADVFQFLALTGLRHGELIWLARGCLDVDRRLLRVRATEREVVNFQSTAAEQRRVAGF